MKVMSRDFTRFEKILLVLLALILVGLVYYRFIYIPVIESIAASEADYEETQKELEVIQERVDYLGGIQESMDALQEEGKLSWMASYNNSKEEIAFLNDILADTIKYSISFANVTRSGDQIRRNFTLQFTTDNYGIMEHMLSALSQNHHRCLIGDLRCTAARNESVLEGNITVNATATFFETMVGGIPDAGLPESKPAA